MFVRRVVNSIRDIWIILGITLLIFAGLEISLRIGFAITHSLHNTGEHPPADFRFSSDVYQNQDWAKDYFNEFDKSTGQEWHPYVYWHRKPFHGKYININDQGIRYTWNKSSAPSVQQVKIFMFGGSTMWGTGARDDFTIPSLVSQKLKAKGNSDVWITNFGESGFVSTQELIALILELRKGHVPDIAVFYDGVNDTFAALQSGAAGAGNPQNEKNRALEFNSKDQVLLARKQLNWREGFVEKLAFYRFSQLFVKPFNHFPPPAYSAESDQNNDLNAANAVINIYFSNLRLIKSLAQSYGFSVVFYWQPTAHTKKFLSDWEKKQLNLYKEVSLYRQVHKVLKYKLATLKGDDFYDLSSAFDDNNETVFIDPFHISEAGNNKIADLIVQTLPEKILRK